MSQLFQEATFEDVPAFGIGHYANAEALSGCTVIVAPQGAAGSVDVRGGGPATRETDLLEPEKMIQLVHGVVLSGGSAFGLESACGVAEELSGRGIGFPIAGACVPIVPAACLFDLPVGSPWWPDKAAGAEAARAALAFAEAPRADLAQGCVGAGTGATVGKMGDPRRAMKGGFGWAGVKLGSLAVVACVAVNAAGNVTDGRGGWLAGTIGDDGAVTDPLQAFAAWQQAQAFAQGQGPSGESGPCANTTIGCVLTNASLTKTQCKKVAQVAHDGYARAIFPVHTQGDGDAIFVLASGPVEGDVDTVSIMASVAMERAIRNGVAHACGAAGLKAVCDLA